VILDLEILKTGLRQRLEIVQPRPGPDSHYWSMNLPVLEPAPARAAPGGAFQELVRVLKECGARRVGGREAVDGGSLHVG